MSWQDRLWDLIIEAAVFIVFFLVSVPLVVVVFTWLAERVRQFASRHQDIGVRMMTSLATAFLMALFWVTYQASVDWLKLRARDLGLEGRYELAIFTLDGQETRAAKHLEELAKQQGFQTVYVTKGLQQDYANEPRIIWFNDKSHQAVINLLKSSTEFEDTLICDDSVDGTTNKITDGYVEFWFPDEPRSTPNACRPRL